VFLALLIPSIDLALRRGVLRAGFGELDSSGKAQRPCQRSQTWVDDGPTADDALRHDLNSAFSARASSVRAGVAALTATRLVAAARHASLLGDSSKQLRVFDSEPY
jgi:hypothetical protein